MTWWVEPKEGGGALIKYGTIVERFQEYSGQTAVLDGDGRCFDEIRQERLKESHASHSIPQAA
jgi:hypothetical protein